MLFAVNPRGLDRFEQQSLGGFKHRLLAHILHLFPYRARQLGEARVRQIIDRSVAVGERAGLATEEELARYTLIGVAAGDELASTPHARWATPVLDRRDLPADHKIARLQALARRHGLSFADPARA